MGQDFSAVPAEDGQGMGNGLFFTDVGGNDVDGAAIGVSMDHIAKVGVDFFTGSQRIFRVVNPKEN